MMSRLFRILSFVLALALIVGGWPLAARAQSGGERYTNAAVGVAFDLPAGWQVHATEGALLAATPDDIAQVEAGGAPVGLEEVPAGWEAPSKLWDSPAWRAAAGKG